MRLTDVSADFRTGEPAKLMTAALSLPYPVQNASLEADGCSDDMEVLPEERQVQE